MELSAIRRLTNADIGDCLRLSQDREWPLEDRKWQLLFEVGEVYGLDAPDGGLAGVVVCTRYDARLAAVSMMLVARRFGRRGIGTALMCYVLRHAAAATVVLTATDCGRPLYEKVGFRTIGSVTKYTGVYRGTATVKASRPARLADLPSMVTLDHEVFGAHRDALLTRLQTFSAQFRVIDGSSGVTGFVGAWRNIDNTVIGPTVAADAAAAAAMIADVAAGNAGELRLDLEDRHPELISWAEQHGLERGSRTAHMLYGEALPGDRSRLFTPVMVALG